MNLKKFLSELKRRNVWKAAMAYIIASWVLLQVLDLRVDRFPALALLEQREAGAAILLISEELEELLALSDRLAVIYNGQIMGVVPTDQADINEIGLMMTGSQMKTTA